MATDESVDEFRYTTNERFLPMKRTLGLIAGLLLALSIPIHAEIIGGGAGSYSNSAPLPVAGVYAASGVTPITGTFAATGQSAAFTPIAGRNFNINLQGTFVASVQLERSFDSGSTWNPITGAGVQLYVWTAPASESDQETEVIVIYRLNCTAYTSGTVTYRLSQ